MPRKSSSLDLTDPVQLRFVTRRLHAQGITPKTAPHLYEVIDAIRDGKLRNANAPSPQSAFTPIPDEERCDHYLTSRATDSSSSMTNYQAEATAGCFRGSAYTYVDNALYHYSNGSASYIDATYDEEFEDGRNVRAPAIAGEASDSVGLLQDSFVIDVLYDDSYVLYYRSTYITPICEMAITNPRDLNQDGVMRICLGRTGSDCDGNEFSGDYSGELYIPLAGRYVYVPTSYELTGLSEFNATVHNKRTGGVCGSALEVDDLSSDDYTIDSDNNEITFDFVNNFGRMCNDPDDDVTFSVDIVATSGSGECTAHMFVEPIDFRQGCLRGDSQVLIADGMTAVSIETLAARDTDAGSLLLMRDTAGGLRTVNTVSMGPEFELVRLEDEHGRVLEASDTHPIMTVHGPLPAELLRVGDVVETVDGPSALTAVERVLYDGPTYNFGVSDARGDVLPVERSTFIANGFVVGDLAPQNRLESLGEQVARPASHTDWQRLLRTLKLR